MENIKPKTTYSSACLFLSVLFIFALNFSNIVVQKPFYICGLVFLCSIVIQPMIYVLSDIFSEVYGYTYSRRVTWYACIINVLMVLLFNFTIAVNPGFENQEAWELVLGSTWRIVLASLTAVMVSDWINDILFAMLRRKFNGRWFGVRSLLTSIAGNIIDTIIFFCIALWGVYSLGDSIWIMFTDGVLWKLVYQTCFIPVSYWIIKKLKALEGPDCYRDTRKYSLFG